MRTDDLDYDLPSGLIAQRPVEPRDASRLLVVAEGQTRDFGDHAFRDLPSLLPPGTVLVRNDTRVLPARTHFRRPTGGRLELLFLEPAEGDVAGAREWEVLVGGRPRVGETLEAEGRPGLTVEVCERLGGGRWRVRAAGPLASLLERIGETPLPPYIHEPLDDPERYQTVYARAPGSAAAPTAGLHFTPALTDRLRAGGVAVEHLTLHVGLATFKPVATDEVEDHPIHDEPYVVDPVAWRRILAAKADGRPVVAVGTTMVRLLEDLAARYDPSFDSGDPLTGRTSVFITPGFRFRVVTGMVTNFHLPRTSLLALVMAFCGVDTTRAAYRHAIERSYRFYSFGDAMIAWRGSVAGGRTGGELP